MKLIQINAPHFCAGIEIENGRCVRAAPILKWAVGKTEEELLSYFRRKNYGSVEPNKKEADGVPAEEDKG